MIVQHCVALTFKYLHRMPVFLRTFPALLFLLFLLPVTCLAQDDLPAEKQFGRYIFLPSVEVGYLHNRAPELSGGLLMKTSIEGRWRNNNDVFMRLNYDNSDAQYSVVPTASLSAVEGKTRFSDALAGLGYRFGDSKWRMFLLAQVGFRFYNYPVFEQTSTGLLFKDIGGRATATRATLGFEYYFDEKSALTVEIMEAHVWNSVDFWQANGAAWGFSVGVITSLF